MTTILKRNKYYALVHFLPLPLKRQSESPPGSTKLDDETGHNCKMPHSLYRIFCTSVLGLPLDSWAITRSEAAFKNLILHNLDAMMYYFDTDTYYKNEPISLPGDLKDMATIFARLTLLLVGADACTPHIINSVWGEDDDARLALGTRRPTRRPVPYPTPPTHAFQSSHQHCPHLAHRPNHSHPSPHV